MDHGRAAARALDEERLSRERVILRIRALALGFNVVQSTVRTGDSVALTWALVVLLLLVQGAVAALLRRPDRGRVRAAGWVGMAGDALAVCGALANNLDDPADPIFLVVVLLALEASLRWGQVGGLVGGVAGGGAAAAWSVRVVGSGSTLVEYATMRFTVLLIIGGILGGLVERLHAERSAMADMAFTDGLTGLANRGALRRELEGSLAVEDGVALLFLDLDGFKAVNDAHGHAVGDALLVAVGERLRGRVRDDDLAARYGGDEFVVVLGRRGDVRVDDVAARLAAAFDDPFAVDGRALRIGVSTGVVVAGPRDTVDTLLVRADAAMYEAKRGRAA